MSLKRHSQQHDMTPERILAMNVLEQELVDYDVALKPHIVAATLAKEHYKARFL